MRYILANLIMPVLCCVLSIKVVDAEPLKIAKDARQLFLDDQVVQRIEGLRRITNQATKSPNNPVVRREHPWEQFRAMIYGTVLYDEQDQLFKMWYTCMPHNNTQPAVKINGEQLRGWLDRSAGMFNRIEPGSTDAKLLSDSFPSYNFDVIDGVSYQIDLSQPNRFDKDGAEVAPGTTRIVNLTFGGQPVTDDMEFVVATNNYRASGGGSFPGAMGDTVIFEGPDTNRDIIVRYIVEKGTISPAADANWTFAPMDGTTVLFETGPGAAKYASDVKGVTIEEAGAGEGGFALFRITL